MNEKDFIILYNALSVGWHLRKIAEVTEDPMTEEQWKRFIMWMERHNLKRV